MSRTAAIACALVGVVSACEDAAPRMGAVEVRVAESGVDLGHSAFEVRFDINGLHSLGPGNSVVIAAKPGHHDVAIAGVAGNCTVQGGNNRSVDVVPGDTIIVAFTSSCVTRAGDILVESKTSGADIPPAFEVLIDSSAAGSVNDTVLPNGSFRFGGIKEGMHSVTLHTADNCPVVLQRQEVFVRHGATTNVSFFTNCALVRGALRVTTTTAGADLDADGYSLELISAGFRHSYPVPANGTTLLDGIPNGTYRLKSSGAARNCAFGAATDTSAVVPRRDTIGASIAVTCAPATKLRISASSTGSDVDPQYRLVLQQTGKEPESFDVPSSGETLLSPLDSGTMQLTVEQLAFNCDASPPATIRLANGQTTNLAINTACAKAGTIAFMFDHSIFLLRTNEDSAKFLAANVGQPSWSPDGTRLAARSYGGGNEDIMLLTLGGTVSSTRLTSDQKRDNHPAWSPDGSRILFMSERRGRSELFTMTPTGADVTLFAGGEANYREPSWASDGRVTFVRDSGDATGIYVVAAVPAGKTLVVQPKRGNATPSLSPDGTKIVYSTFVDCENENLYWCSRIIVANADGTGAFELTSTSSYDTGPAWSPDGAWIVFGRDWCQGCDNGLIAVRLDRTKSKTLVAWAGATDPAWKP